MVILDTSWQVHSTLSSLRSWLMFHVSWHIHWCVVFLFFSGHPEPKYVRFWVFLISPCCHFTCNLCSPPTKRPASVFFHETPRGLSASRLYRILCCRSETDDCLPLMVNQVLRSQFLLEIRAASCLLLLLGQTRRIGVGILLCSQTQKAWCWNITLLCQDKTMNRMI